MSTDFKKIAEAVKNFPVSVTLLDGKPVDDSYKETDPETGQKKDYIVIDKNENFGFKRPYRTEYFHIKCDAVTRLHPDIARTFATEPLFYSGTFCGRCKNHFPLSEFRWLPDHSIVGE